MNERDTLKFENNVLHIGGCSTLELAKEYGTPIYVMDEEYIEDMCRVYTDTLKNNYPNSLVLYASKAFCCKEIYRIISRFEMGCDTVSAGEILTAHSAGFDCSKIYFHGNNKTDKEIRIALDHGVVKFVLDNLDEIERLDKIITKEYKNKKIDVLLRINPGVEAHTHSYIQTANPDSKFGVNFETAISLIKVLGDKETLNFTGLHCHIGSQIFEKKSFEIATEKMVDFIGKLKNKFGIKVQELDMGGGFGIWYNDEDAKKSSSEYSSYLLAIIDVLKAGLKKYNLEPPCLMVEPGRSIVGEAGITLYTVGTIKEIEKIRKYLCVDGGMFENPRYCLYQAKYTPVKCKKEDKETEKVTIAGKCCESGDILAVDCEIEKCEIGDVIAILSTGAYNYSMASNYNRNPIPAVIMVKDGKSRVVVKGQDYKDMFTNDI